MMGLIFCPRDVADPLIHPLTCNKVDLTKGEQKLKSTELISFLSICKSVVHVPRFHIVDDMLHIDSQCLEVIESLNLNRHLRII